MNTNKDSSVFDFFQLFFPRLPVMQHVAQETNKYYVFFTKNLPPAPLSRFQNWKDTTTEELYTYFFFFAIVKLMSRVKKTRKKK
jgi:hypothetical protein